MGTVIVYRWCHDHGPDVVMVPQPNPWAPYKTFVYASTDPRSWRYPPLYIYEMNLSHPPLSLSLLDKVIVVDANLEPGIGKSIDEWLKNGFPITKYNKELDWDTVLIPFPVRALRLSEEDRQKYLEGWSE